MDPRYTGEILKHLEKQNELLTEVHRSMSHELHKLQVEEEMLMRKFYELMTAHGLTKRMKKTPMSQVMVKVETPRLYFVYLAVTNSEDINCQIVHS